MRAAARNVAPSRAAVLGRGMFAALRLGWAVEANWAHPLAYLTLLLLRPVGGVLILVVIYAVAVGQPAGSAAVGYLVVGAAMWTFAMNGLQRVTFTVVQEREWFRVLKYIVLTPLPFALYVVARSAVWVVTGGIGAAVILALGSALLRLPIAVATIDWGAFLAAMALGLVALVATGLGLAGLTLALARHPVGIGEAVQGTLFLLSGVVFPPAILPGWAAPLASVLPYTYWLEAVRRAVLADYDPATLGIGDPFLPLMVTTAATVAIGLTTFAAFDRRARRDGTYDRTTEY